MAFTRDGDKLKIDTVFVDFVRGDHRKVVRDLDMREVAKNNALMTLLMKKAPRNGRAS